MPIESVLIANRGEIAVRIIRTCRRLGVRTIAVYSDADRQALHVASADEAYRIGPPAASDSYLNVQAILEVAKTAHARAVHPGYGFLSENPAFAEACQATGLVWIGPPPSAMRALGDKARAKSLAEQNGVPLLEGYHGDDQSEATLREHAQRIGLPVLIKASAGGGGRGMRVVETADELGEAVQAARREAKAAFGDDRVLLERFVRRPRHVEVQILGDQHGKLLHLGERECSIQRRHQKLIEESPSPAINAEQRAAMGDAALRLARAAGYTSAGTVEFLLDEQGAFSFLEVNARLQVEHPVTELVTGLDLVELQLEVAAGRPLPIAQQDITLTGHAIEVRVIAEDPLAGWVPSSGTIERFRVPSFVRTDSAIVDGSEVPPYYDSLLAKVISHADTRAAAITQLVEALGGVQLRGVANNVDLLLSTIEHPSFQRGDLHTGFLEEHGILEEVADLPGEVLAAAAAKDFLAGRGPGDPWRGPVPWRLARVDQPAAWQRAGRIHSAAVSSALDGPGVEVLTDEGQRHRVTAAHVDDAALRHLNVDGHIVTVWDHADWLAVEFQNRRYRLQRPPPLNIDELGAGRGRAGLAGRLTAPMPGRIVKIAVQEGEQVRGNQPLVMLEAMKMEHVVQAPHAGLVRQVCVEVGQQVAAGATLLELADPE